MKRKTKFEKSLQYKNPELAREWHPTKNGSLTPSMVAPYSKEEVWWECPKCHNEWEETVYNRSRGNRCDVCNPSNNIGEKGALSQDEFLSKEWNFEMNNGVLPSEVSLCSGKKYWWKCSKCGHEWPAKPNNRVRGKGCPECNNKKVIPGINDLASQFPKVAAEWHPTKNDKKPEDVFKCSDIKVWWKCSKCGYEWPAVIKNRTRHGNGCPKCSDRVLVQGANDLKSQFPEVAAEWDYNKNDKRPEEFFQYSGQKVWFKCKKGHPFEQRINERTIKNKGCPYCQNQKVLKGYNCLESKNPTLAKEWHPTKNNKKPSEVTKSSTYNAWWLCPICKLEWQQTVNTRDGGTGCPYCKMSGPEQEIFKILKDSGLQISIQKTFKECKDQKKLPFDFYIIKDKQPILIEYDGEEHFLVLRVYGSDGVKKLKLKNLHDNIKNDFCKMHRIPLLRIPYWKRKEAKTLIKDFLKSPQLFNGYVDFPKKVLLSIQENNLKF